MPDQSRASFILSQQINQVPALLGIAHGFGDAVPRRANDGADAVDNLQKSSPKLS